MEDHDFQTQLEGSAALQKTLTCFSFPLVLPKVNSLARARARTQGTTSIQGRCKTRHSGSQCFGTLGKPTAPTSDKKDIAWHGMAWHHVTSHRLG